MGRFKINWKYAAKAYSYNQNFESTTGLTSLCCQPTKVPLQLATKAINVADEQVFCYVLEVLPS